MTPFEYLTVLVSVIIGLGITHVIKTVGQLISGHREFKHDWIHTVWMGNILFYMVFFWWFTFKWVNRPDWSFGLFLFVLGYALILYLLAVVLVPMELPDHFDFRAHFERRHRIFFGGFAFILVVDVVDAILKGPENLASLGPLYPWFMGIMIAGALGAAVTKNRLYHTVLAIYWPTSLTAWIVYTMGATSVLQDAA